AGRRQRRGALGRPRYARGPRAADRRARPWRDSRRTPGADRPDARLHGTAARRDARRDRAAPLPQPGARLAAAGRRGAPGVTPIARAPQREPGISRGRKGNHGIGALMLLVCLAVLAQSPRLIATAELGSLLAQRDSNVSV